MRAKVIRGRTMLTCAAASTGADVAHVRGLLIEYADSLGFDLGFQDFDRELAGLPGPYAPPRGCLLLAKDGLQVAGCVALRPLGDDVCELKRLYVRPEFRRKGIGRLLTDAIIKEARRRGYRSVKLDTVSTMREAITLYESMGFRQSDPYCRNPICGAKFFQLGLGDGAG